jgi:hypothetical protein
MKHEKTIRPAARVALVALLALVFWLVWDTTQSEPGHSTLPSTSTARVIGFVCMTVAVAAGGYAVFLLVRAFYLGFTRPELRDRHDHDAS